MLQPVNNAGCELREIIAVGSVSIWRFWKWSRGVKWAMRSGVNQRFAVKSRGSFAVVGLGVDRTVGKEVQNLRQWIGTTLCAGSLKLLVFLDFAKSEKLLNYPLFWILQLFSASANAHAVLVLIHGKSENFVKIKKKNVKCKDKGHY